MASGSSFTPNPLFDEELRRSEMLLPALKSAADRVAESARGIAPVETGDYRDSIAGEAGMDEEGFAAGRVNATDFKAGWIEFGTADEGPLAVLRRGAEAAGYTVEAEK